MLAGQEIVWVTGTHGFIGRHISRTLASKGHFVAGLGHGAWPEMEAAVWGVSAWLNGDIAASNLGQLQRLSGSPKTIYHLAGGSSVGAAIAQPREDFARTVSSTAELLEWVRQYTPNTRIVAISSAAVYGSDHEGPIREDALLTPYSPYGYHKRMMEDLCRSYGASFGLAFAIPRLFSVYGAGLKKQLLWDLCSKLAGNNGEIELGGTGHEIRDWVHVEDVARAVVACADLADTSGPVVNIGSGEPLTVRDVARRMIDAWAIHGHPKRDVVFSGKSRAGDPFSLLADVTRLGSILPCLNHTTDAGFDAYVGWYLAASRGNV
ncbi:SDR family oxidoreductase [Rhizobium grahamii]|uniref:SDR family oxidoreductase n=1 Tax=Rhizobium grahamii TaxID=1120045 RepID=A0A5Q0CC52_9HYPH|nr:MULTISPECIES: SDR family oxidoreductase [Rhizobium]QFY62014.1 SDR family oxidoreductase [Rhizobium grahamii]QRM48809.1 SDR family oxidoreductase [Rhizobium sp. BG6]